MFSLPFSDFWCCKGEKKNYESYNENAAWHHCNSRLVQRLYIFKRIWNHPSRSVHQSSRNADVMEPYKPSRQDKRLCSGNAVLRLFTNFPFCFIEMHSMVNDMQLDQSTVRLLVKEGPQVLLPPTAHAITHSMGDRRSLKWYKAQLWGYTLRFSTYTLPCWDYPFLKASSAHLYSPHPMLNQPFFR